VLRPGQAGRQIVEDLVTGARSLVVRDDSGETRNLTHGLVTGETVEETWTIHPDDPLCASAVIRWEQRLSRGDWRIRTEVLAEQWGDATDLHMTAHLRAWEGDRLVHDRRLHDRVPRHLV
jgi:hypothetical protein